jgi:hypothetical protein
VQETLIKKLAEEIVNQAVFQNYAFYFLVFAISAIGAALGAYGAAYLKRRAENLATKADFDEIIRQLQQTTDVTEGIKAAVSARTAQETARKALIRQKVEAFIEETFNLDSWYGESKARIFAQERSKSNHCPALNKLETYQLIYFPEIKAEMAAVSRAFYGINRWLFELEKAVLMFSSAQKPFDTSVVDNKLDKNYSDFLDALQLVRKKLLDEYAERLS